MTKSSRMPFDTRPASLALPVTVMRAVPVGTVGMTVTRLNWRICASNSSSVAAAADVSPACMGFATIGRATMRTASSMNMLLMRSTYSSLRSLVPVRTPSMDLPSEMVYVCWSVGMIVEAMWLADQPRSDSVAQIIGVRIHFLRRPET